MRWPWPGQRGLNEITSLWLRENLGNADLKNFWTCLKVWRYLALAYDEKHHVKRMLFLVLLHLLDILSFCPPFVILLMCWLVGERYLSRSKT